MLPVLERIRVARNGEGGPRTWPGHLSADKAYSSRRIRRYLRRRHIKHTIPEPKDQRANRRRRGCGGGRPAGFDKEQYKRRNEVERTINRLKSFRAVATRYDKRAYVFHGTVTGHDQPLASSVISPETPQSVKGSSTVGMNGDSSASVCCVTTPRMSLSTRTSFSWSGSSSS